MMMRKRQALIMWPLLSDAKWLIDTDRALSKYTIAFQQWLLVRSSNGYFPSNRVPASHTVAYNVWIESHQMKWLQCRLWMVNDSIIERYNPTWTIGLSFWYSTKTSFCPLYIVKYYYYHNVLENIWDPEFTNF